MQHFKTIGEFNWSYSPETPNSAQNQRFFVLYDFKIWQMTLKNNRASLLCYFKLCASFCSPLWIQTGVMFRKSPNWGKICFDLWPWPLTLTFCIDIMIVNGNNSWKFHDDTMTEILWKKCDGWTNRQTDRSVLRANWLQLKISWMSHLIHRTIRIGVI